MSCIYKSRKISTLHSSYSLHMQYRSTQFVRILASSFKKNVLKLIHMTRTRQTDGSLRTYRSKQFGILSLAWTALAIEHLRTVTNCNHFYHKCMNGDRTIDRQNFFTIGMYLIHRQYLHAYKIGKYAGNILHASMIYR